MLIKSSCLTAAVLILAACGQETPQAATAASTPATASTPSPASAPTVAASAASETAASDVANLSASAASDAENEVLGGKLVGMNQAKWQNYRCDDNQKIEVRYYKSNAGPSAQIKYKGLTFTAPFSAENSNEDLTAFGNGTYTWTIGNQYQSDFYREENGFLVQLEEAEDGTPLENTLVMNCSPI